MGRKIVVALETCDQPSLGIPKLDAVGVDSVADLRHFDPRPVRNALTVVGERIIQELRRTTCLPLDLVQAGRRGCGSPCRSLAG